MQREEVAKLQQEIETKSQELELAEQQARAAAERSSTASSSGTLTPSTGSDALQEAAAAARSEAAVEAAARAEPEEKNQLEVLRERLKQLEADYEEQRKQAQREMSQAKDSVRRVDQETFFCVVSLFCF